MQNLEKYLTKNGWKEDWEETETDLLNLWSKKGNRTNLKVGCLEISTSLASVISYDKIIQTLAEQAKSQELDILLCPEWLFLHKEIFTKEEKESLVREIAQLTSSIDCLIIPGTIVWQENGKVRNSAPVLYKGKVIKEYVKHRDGGDRDIAKSIKLEAEFGTEIGTNFKWEGLNIGLEICADHGCISDNPKIKNLDLQVIISCGMSLHMDDLRKLRKGGYGILCDGCGPRSDVIKTIKSNRMWDRDYKQEKPTNQFELPEDQASSIRAPKFSIYHLEL